jgi:hypothetical protein
LAERAIGYSVDVEECFVINGKVHKEIVRKYYPPDVTACIYWTKNRMPDRWRDVQRHEVNAVGLKSAEELRQLLAADPGSSRSRIAEAAGARSSQDEGDQSKE